jgi:hypothetical protein
MRNEESVSHRGDADEDLGSAVVVGVKALADYVGLSCGRLQDALIG